MKLRHTLLASILLTLVVSAVLGCRNQASMEQLEQGQQAYQAHCALCHGDYGEGDGPLAETLIRDSGVQPARLANETLLNRLGRAGIRESIEYGGASVGGSRHMPLWGPHLGARLMDRIADYVTTLPVQPPAVRQKIGRYLESPAGTEPRGRRLYVHYCSGCHGPWGKGKGLFNEQFRKYLKPKDLTDANRLATLNDAELSKIVGQGGAHAAQAGTMSGWINFLEPRQVDAVASYVRAISRTPDPGE